MAMASNGLTGTRVVSGKQSDSILGMLGAFLAALVIGWARIVGAGPDPSYLASSFVAAMPAAFVLAKAAQIRPAVTALGALGLVSFSLALVVKTAVVAGPEPLFVALVCELLLGSVAMRRGRARATDVLWGILLTYASVTFIYEVGILVRAT
jgi:hypothetical protein